ncbi:MULTISPECIES: hypothetical protein [Alphaproteobacteria]|uniref:hypothetical protein n=1 Tax=Alphaproteobacteria TaxID=28211 RepID=UPI000824E81B|nr:hypothetical protein [Novosphingobium sp. NBM11]MBF5088535.1 hypothetical protein [Novosphingobium sp. NBM11]NTE96292.1 hypothetical protein [Agrobacterium tumefaciens]TQN60978.1 hypothetical protein FLX27_15000 [Agrobacterium tumefaciens]
MTSQVTDVLEAVQSLIAKGYDREYRVKDGNLVDLELGSTLDACSIRVDAALRLESGDDGEDASNIYAITDPATEHKGLLIDAFDVFHEICPRDLSERLEAHRETAPAGDQDAPSKHGLRKVYKSEFHSDPERYVLREGFPDFPPCPFGQSFSILGFDTAEQEYVWLVTSIIRDPRLIRVPYQGEDVISDE